jgi:hypothetical protein
MPLRPMDDGTTHELYGAEIERIFGPDRNSTPADCRKNLWDTKSCTRSISALMRWARPIYWDVLDTDVLVMITWRTIYVFRSGYRVLPLKSDARSPTCCKTL